ncbi:hypothetical protein ARSEF1564_007982 [Beauveria bassiana]
MAQSNGVVPSGINKRWPTPHTDNLLLSWNKLRELVRDGSFEINGESLQVAAVVATARHGCKATVKKDPDVQFRIESSVSTLHDYLDKGYFLYGVNTGFGGSADARTKDLYGLQRALMQHTQSAILTAEDKSDTQSSNEYLGSHSMPSAWTRATMLLRCNTNIRGHSAITANTVQTMIKLLHHDIVPIVPLRGSISASGDLMPLSYVSGAIQGSPDIFVRVGCKIIGSHKIMTAEQALRGAGITPVVLSPKEGLSLINGTSAAAAVATLGLWEANQLALVSQMLTALSSEALGANDEWAHPFIAAVRPHSGQIEAAQNIRTFVKGSKLVYGLEQTKDRFKAGLAQERYALRSSPQWLSPLLEDLMSAEKQLTVEINSTTDNPVVNVADNDIHCGANFQAAAVTSATEKIRLALQSIGKMLFAQTSEMINHDLSNGLPPNLAADDPSLSFCLKGIDVNTAAYTSELGFLANPVSNHVQSAEMHNQAINSLGLLSARKTMEAVEVLSLIVANCMYTACQGVDIRTMHKTFLIRLTNPIRDLISTLTGGKENVQVKGASESTTFFHLFWREFEDAWYRTAHLDAGERCEKVSETLVTVMVMHSTQVGVDGLSASKLEESRRALSALTLETYTAHRESFFRNPTTSRFLGDGTKAMYLFVREQLGVPMHRGLVEHPVAGAADGNMIDGRPKKTIGSWVSIIYEAIRAGSFADAMLEFVGASTDVKWSANGKQYSNGAQANGDQNGHLLKSSQNGHQATNGQLDVNGSH